MVVTRSRKRKEKPEKKLRDGMVDVGKIVYLPDRPEHLENGVAWYELVLQFNPVGQSLVLVMNAKLVMKEYKISSLMVCNDREQADKVRTKLIEFGRRYGASFADPG